MNTNFWMVVYKSYFIPNIPGIFGIIRIKLPTCWIWFPDNLKEIWKHWSAASIYTVTFFFDQLCQSNEEQKSQIEKMMAGKGRGGYKGVK